MNSLVAYGADSDEELTPERRRSTATPPRQDKEDAAQEESLRKIQAKQRRKDSEHWADSDEEASDRSSKRSRDGSPRSDDSPGPLLRQGLQPSGAGLRPVHSTSSLLNYGGTDVVDEFDKDFISSGSPHKPSATREPEPPKRPEDNDDSDQSPDELDIEQTEDVLDEGLRALKEHAASREGSATPHRDASTGAETPGRVEEIVGLPPSPPGQCSEEVEARFAHCFERKAHGANYNDQIKLRKDFKNPAIYEVLVEKFNLDEKGSNFPASVYDPHAFSEGDFYEALGEKQRKVTEKAQAAAADSSKPKKKTRFGA